jgi:hypothetical protein
MSRSPRSRTLLVLHEPLVEMIPLAMLYLMPMRVVPNNPRSEFVRRFIFGAMDSRLMTVIYTEQMTLRMQKSSKGYEKVALRYPS